MATSRSRQKRQQIAQGATSIGVEPASSPMLGRIVDHVAALAQCGQVARCIVGRIVVEMRARDIDPGHTHDRRHPLVGRTDPTPPPVAPVPAIGVPPPPVAQMEHPPTVRTPAMLASPVGTTKADQLRQLGPVDRIKPTMFRHDRHWPILNHPNEERKGNIGNLTASESKRRRIAPPPSTGDAGAIAPMGWGRPHQQTSRRSVPRRFLEKQNRASSRQLLGSGDCSSSYAS